MLRTTFKRIIRTGYLSFRRNGWLSTATIMVMVLVLFVIGNLIFLGAFAQTALLSLESKIDISVYFAADATESGIMAVKNEVETLPEVLEVEYISKEEALVRFREQYHDNSLINEALEELGENPLVASLNIRANEAGQYAAISEFLAGKKYPQVEKIDYFENQAVIERFSSIITAVRGSGALLAILLAFISILVAFNTIRLAIYTMREEIGIMRLVGGTTWFIRGPFLVAGVLYGAIAAVVTILIFFPLTWAVTPGMSVLVPHFILFDYFLANILQFSLILLITGVALGMISSFIAIRRYLLV